MIGLRWGLEQCRHPLAIIFRFCGQRPIADSLIDLIGTDILAHHGLGFVPATIEGIGIGKILTHFGRIIASAQSIGQHRNPSAGLTCQRQGQPAIGRWNSVLPIIKQGHCFMAMASANAGKG